MNQQKPPKFRSYFEQTIAAWLDKNKIKYEYEQHSFKYKSRIKNGVCEVCGSSAVQLREYTPDFYFPDYGFFVECKGRLDSNDRKKMRDFKRVNPDVDVRILLQSNNLIEAGTGRTGGDRYSDWCEKFGFRYALRSIDARWFK